VRRAPAAHVGEAGAGSRGDSLTAQSLHEGEREAKGSGPIGIEAAE
jgi:hypothetical protein